MSKMSIKQLFLISSFVFIMSMVLNGEIIEASDRWYKLLEDNQERVIVYLDSSTFSSNMDKHLDEYEATCWTRDVRLKEPPQEMKAYMQIKLDSKTMRIKVRYLQRIMFVKGEVVKRAGDTGWMAVIPDSNEEVLCLSIFNYDSDLHTAK